MSVGRLIAATSAAFGLWLGAAVAQVPQGRVYVLHSPAAGACPSLDWHIVLEGNDRLGGIIAWNYMQSVARASGSINMQTRTFQMTATEVGGQGRTANINGTVGQEGWLVANISGPNINCQGIDVRWFVPPPVN